MNSVHGLGLRTRPALACAWALLLCFAILGPAQAQPGNTRVLGHGGGEDPPVLQVVSRAANQVEMEFSLPALVSEDLEVDGEVFQGLAIPRGGVSGEIGHPMLPTFSRFVAIPDRAGARVEYSVVEEEELDGYRLIPVQEETGSDFAYDAQAYARDDFEGVATAAIGRPVLMRDQRLVALHLSPVSYNPSQGKIRVARRVRITVTFAGEDLENAAPDRTRPIATSFDRLFSNLVVNYERGDREVRSGAWLLITPNDPAVITRLQPLIQWRQRKGMPVVMATTAETGTTNLAIKTFIQNAYDHWTLPPEYIVLAGDASGSYNIPTWFENLSGYNGEGDHPYTQLAGGDVVSDAHLGRLSFNNLTELETIVNKIVGYESTPFVAEPAWYSRATLVGDPDNPSGFSCVQTMQSVKTRLLQLNYSPIDTVFNSPYVSQMSAALNRGNTLFCYRGYLGMSGWSNTNTNSLTNGWKMPFNIISTCGTGSFANETCISEAFLRAGTPTNPRAAIASTATATWGTHTRFNNAFVLGAAGGLLWEEQYAMGAAHTRGKTELYLEYGMSWEAYLVTVFSYWNNLMGDPAAECWTSFPTPLTAEYPAGLFIGGNSLVVIVSESGGSPAAGATVCLWKGSETYATGRTDAQGRVDLPISLLTAGDALLTISKHDRQPLLVSIPVTGATRFVGYLSSTLNDDATPPSSGDGNGLPSPTETIELPVQLQNFGTDLTPGVTATLTSTDPYIESITQPTAVYGDLAGGASAWGDQAFVFTIAPTCPEGYVLRFGLDVVSDQDQWHSLITFTAVSSDLGGRGYHWYNAGPGGILDPGETVQVSIGLKNFGSQAALAPSARLISQSRYVSVLAPNVAYADIPVNGFVENTAAPFTVSASADCFNGHSAPMLLVLTFNGGRQDTAFVNLVVGTRTAADPTGPDQYGYLAYENTDLTYPDHPTYSWVEIDPTLGGSGTEIVLGDFGEHQDKTRQVMTPFPIQYYGQTYTMVSVCSNGWIVPGYTYVTDYRNWTLPSLGGPNGVIAAYWDDIYQSGPAKAYQWYDAANHRWVIEWSGWRNRGGQGTETFQVLFFDPAYHVTETGDAIILFQYNTINNPDGTDGNCTIGIEKPDNSDAVLFTYFNQFTPGSTSLISSRAIRFVPRRSSPTGITEEEQALVLPGLRASVPNPLHEGDVIRFTAPAAGKVSLTVHDVQGRMVRHLLDGPVTAGTQSVRWDGRDDLGRALSTGVYFYRLRAGEALHTQKAIVIR